MLNEETKRIKRVASKVIEGLVEIICEQFNFVKFRLFKLLYRQIIANHPYIRLKSSVTYINEAKELR